MGRIRSDQLKVGNNEIIVGKQVASTNDVGSSLPVSTTSDVQMTVGASDVSLTIQSGSVESSMIDMTGSWDFSSTSFVGVPAPSTADSATTKSYVDAAVSGAGKDELISASLTTSTSTFSYTVPYIPQQDSSSSDGAQYKIRVSLNGLELRQGTDYTLTLNSPSAGETTVNLTLPYSIDSGEVLSFWIVQ